MSNKMPANVLKSECLRLFHLISAGVGAGWIVEGRMRNSMKLSHNQEAMLSL